jgi:hypothetical protein
MPLGGSNARIDIRGTGRFDTEVSQVATVKQIPGSEHRITVTGTELALVQNALDEAERVSRFGMEVLDDVDNSRDAEPAMNSRLRQEIDNLAMREASLRSLQKTMSEVDRGGKPASTRFADLGQFSAGAALPVPRPR